MNTFQNRKLAYNFPQFLQLLYRTISTYNFTKVFFIIFVHKMYLIFSLFEGVFIYVVTVSYIQYNYTITMCYCSYYNLYDKPYIIANFPPFHS